MLSTDIGENRERDRKECQKGPVEKLAEELLHVKGKKVPQARERTTRREDTGGFQKHLQSWELEWQDSLIKEA